MSSATGPLDTPHSDSDSERTLTLTASFPDYRDPTSARSPDTTFLVGTRLAATPANHDELRHDAIQPFFPRPFVADLCKHIISPSLLLHLLALLPSVSLYLGSID